MCIDNITNPTRVVGFKLMEKQPDGSYKPVFYWGRKYDSRLFRVGKEYQKAEGTDGFHASESEQDILKILESKNYWSFAQEGIKRSKLRIVIAELSGHIKHGSSWDAGNQIRGNSMKILSVYKSRKTDRAVKQLKSRYILEE